MNAGLHIDSSQRILIFKKVPPELGMMAMRLFEIMRSKDGGFFTQNYSSAVGDYPKCSIK